MTHATGGELVAKMLKKEGLKHVFTLSGLHVAPIYDGCVNEDIAVVDTRHEQAAAHAADAYARITKRPAVAIVTAGPGVTDAITGIANAKHAESPVLLIGGAAPQALATKGALQEVEQVDLFKPITKFAARVEKAEHCASFVAAALRAMTTGRPGPAFLEMPWDIISESVDLDRITVPESYRPQRLARLADESMVEAAAKALSNAKRPVIMAGNSVHWDDSHGIALELAKLVDAPLYFNGMARSCFDVNDAHVFSKSRREALLEGDVVLLIGAPLDFRLGYGNESTLSKSAIVISIDQDGSELGRNRDVQVPLVGDSKSVLTQIVRAAKKADHNEWRATLRTLEEKSLAKQRVREQANDSPITHFRFARALADAIDDNTIVVADGGNIVSVTAKVLERKVPGTWLDPGPFGCLGVGAPFALAAKLLHPNRHVVVVQGDGSFGLNGFDYDTCLRFGCPVTAVVGNDAAWGQIWLPQKAIYGEARAVGTLLRPTRYDKVVEALGGVGFHVEKAEELTPTIKQAMGSGTVACVDVTIDRLALEGAGGGAYAI